MLATKRKKRRFDPKGPKVSKGGFCRCTSMQICDCVCVCLYLSLSLSLSCSLQHVCKSSCKELELSHCFCWTCPSESGAGTPTLLILSMYCSIFWSLGISNKATLKIMFERSSIWCDVKRCLDLTTQRRRIHELLLSYAEFSRFEMCP